MRRSLSLSLSLTPSLSLSSSSSFSSFSSWKSNSTPLQGIAVALGVLPKVLIVYAGPVRSAASLRDVLCLPTDIHPFIPCQKAPLLSSSSSASASSLEQRIKEFVVHVDMQGLEQLHRLPRLPLRPHQPRHGQPVTRAHNGMRSRSTQRILAPSPHHYTHLHDRGQVRREKLKSALRATSLHHHKKSHLSPH